MNVIGASITNVKADVVRQPSAPDRLYLIFAGTAISMTDSEAVALAECLLSVAVKREAEQIHKILHGNQDIVCERVA